MRIPTVLALVVGIVFVAGQASDAKKWTIYERQSALTKRINAAEKAKELTFKEADNLRDDLADVQEDKVEMMAKNAGKLSYEDEDKLEKRLNRISAAIHKDKLNKRVANR